MRSIKQVLLIAAIAFIAFIAQTADAASYKCKNAAGRIEYSDIPCATDKDELSKPKSGPAAAKPLVAPMQQLQALFKEYETRLCAREKLASEIDMANRSGEFGKNPAVWKTRQDGLIDMNETLIEFQGKSGQIVRPTGSDSPEADAMRKFQVKLKDCGKPASN